MKYVTSAAILYALYFLMCYLGTGTDEKNMRNTNFYSFSDSVQEKIRQDKQWQDKIPPQKNVLTAFLSNLILFTIVFIGIGYILQLHSFQITLIYFLILGEGLNLFDLIIIDWCWWCHTKRVRIKGIGTERDYQDMHKHIASFGRAIPMFALAALLASCILQWII